MPISTHPSFEEPAGDARLWRYMDLPRFCGLLTQRELWFSTAEALAMDDPHEGLFPRANYNHRNWTDIDSIPSDELARIENTSYGPRDSDIQYKITRERWNRDHLLKNMFIYRRSLFVNCWHELDHESVAMWKIYGSPGAGVAIVTSTGKLKKAFNVVEEDIYLGRVRYVTENDPPVDASNIFNAALTKRSAFAYEQEVRLIYSSGAWVDIPGTLWDPVSGCFTESPLLEAYEKREQPIGRGFVANLESIADEVWISPFAPTWLDAIIERLCNTYGFRVAVRRSGLLTPPPR